MHIVYALSLDFFARKSTEGLLSYGVRGRAGEVGDESPPPPVSTRGGPRKTMARGGAGDPEQQGNED